MRRPLGAVYRGDPAAHSKGESILLLAALVVALLAGAVLLAGTLMAKLDRQLLAQPGSKLRRC